MCHQCTAVRQLCVRCIGHKTGWGVRLGMAEESSIGQGFLCGIEGSQRCVIPSEHLGLWRRGGKEGMQWLHQLSAMRKESMVKVDQADELP